MRSTPNLGIDYVVVDCELLLRGKELAAEKIDRGERRGKDTNHVPRGLLSRFAFTAHSWVFYALHPCTVFLNRIALTRVRALCWLGWISKKGGRKIVKESVQEN